MPVVCTQRGVSTRRTTLPLPARMDQENSGARAERRRAMPAACSCLFAKAWARLASPPMVSGQANLRDLRAAHRPCQRPGGARYVGCLGIELPAQSCSHCASMGSLARKPSPSHPHRKGEDVMPFGVLEPNPRALRCHCMRSRYVCSCPGESRQWLQKRLQTYAKVLPGDKVRIPRLRCAKQTVRSRDTMAEIPVLG
jgi:hypothetical protein